MKADLRISIEGLRSEKGKVLLCLTGRTGAAFLQCDQDPARISRAVRPGEAASIEVPGLVPGEYSLLVIHDENGNGRLDTRFGIPREGFGFSRNPALRMGPPRYESVHFTLPGGQSEQRIKVRYLL